jgi:glucose-1-phosphate adenylyltransferase
MASVPFGCRYRLIDFALSNMVNSDITKVGIVTHNNYQSLFDHIGNGKDWDLARRSGGIKILPPFISSYSSPMRETLYSTRLEALMGVMGFIKNCKEDHLVLSDCDVICNTDLSEVLRYHEDNQADITVVSTNYRFGDVAYHSNIVKLECDDEGRLTGLSKEKPTEGVVTISSNIIVVKRSYLMTLLTNAAARGQKDFYLDAMLPNIGKDRYFVYRYEGYYAAIASLEGFFAANMELLSREKSKQLFQVPGFPIYTKVRNSAPTKYSADAVTVNASDIKDSMSETLQAGDLCYDFVNKVFYYVDKVSKYEDRPNGSWVPLLQ